MAGAQTRSVAFSAQYPTQYVDNTAIPATAALAIAIDCGPNSTPAGAGWTFVANLIRPATNVTASVPVALTHCAAHVRDGTGPWSAFTAAVTLPPLPPPALKPPTGLTIIIVQ